MPVTCQSHTDHMSVTCQSHPSHMSVTCQSHPSHIPVTSQSHVSHIPVTCQSHAGHMPVTCQSHTGHMPVTCQSHASHMPVTCQSHASHIPVICQSHASHMSARRQLHVYAWYLQAPSEPHLRQYVVCCNICQLSLYVSFHTSWLITSHPIQSKSNKSILYTTNPNLDYSSLSTHPFQFTISDHSLSYIHSHWFIKKDILWYAKYLYPTTSIYISNHLNII